MPRRSAGETSVNDRGFKGSGQNAVPTRALVSYGRIFDHPLFDWSNYHGSKSLKTGVELQNMDLGGKGYFVYVFERRSYSLLLCHTFWGAQIVFCLRGPLAIGQAGNLASPPLVAGEKLAWWKNVEFGSETNHEVPFQAIKLL
ncbi:hypothetical protein AVEN_254120-1 [Araneus ventricosus]|uniref:Uncharacterized protein n=1 Tax=Araneus ventricosus TaxID=182803 RepID=A0A4Y2BZ38_ARAVE|nr:hypothetical protein AVEN_254120-1 [Araneus ventricosus]